MKIIFILCFLICISFVHADNYTADVAIYSAISTPIYCDVAYDDLFKIQNHDYKSLPSKSNISVSYNYSFLDEIYLGSFNKTINSYSRSKTGYLLINCSAIAVSEYIKICGSIKSYFMENGESFFDNNIDNNNICFNLSVVNGGIESCNISFNFSLKEFIVNNSKQSLFFDISNKTYPFMIEYWIEDVFGNIVKKPYNTSNTNTKSFTPKWDGVSRFNAYFAKSRLSFVGCNNSLDNSIIALPFVALFSGPVENFIKLSSTKTEYNEGSKIRIRLKGYKNESGKNAIYIKVYGRSSKVLQYYTFYATSKNNFFDFEFAYVVPPCSNLSKINIIANGIDAKDEYELKIIPKCKKKNVIVENAVTEEEILNSSSLEINSLYSLQKKINDDLLVKLYSRVSGFGNTNFRLYSLDDGYEKTFSQEILGVKKINISLPISLFENESYLTKITRHYILSASNEYGEYSFKPLTVILENNAKVKNVIIVKKNESKFNASVITGNSIIEYEDTSLKSVHLIVGFLLFAQIGFGSWQFKNRARGAKT